MKIILTAAERAEIETVVAVFGTRKDYSEAARDLFEKILPDYTPGDTYEACTVAEALLAHAEVEMITAHLGIYKGVPMFVVTPHTGDDEQTQRMVTECVDVVGKALAKSFQTVRHDG